MLRHLPVKAVLSIKVEDATDDDPQVWQYYAEGLVAALDWLKALGQEMEMESEALFAERSSRVDLCKQWIGAADADNTMRKADMLMMAEAAGVGGSRTRSAAVTAMYQEVMRISHSISKGHSAANTRLW